MSTMIKWAPRPLWKRHAACVEHSGEFAFFPRLPPEIRRLIWVAHFQSPRTHAVLRTPGVNCPYQHRVFSRAWDTRINREAYGVSLEYEKWRGETYLAANGCLSTWDRCWSACWRRSGSLTVPAFYLVPAAVNWEEDIVYLGEPACEDPLAYLLLLAWSAIVQHLAIDIGTFSFNFAEHGDLPPLPALKTLYLILSPLDEFEPVWRLKPVDRFGFHVLRHDLDYGLTTIAPMYGHRGLADRVIADVRKVVAKLQRHYGPDMTIEVRVNLDMRADCSSLIAGSGNGPRADF